MGTPWLKVSNFATLDLDYTAAVTACGTISALVECLRDWRWIAPDALAQAERLSQEDWDFVRRHRKSEGGEALRACELGGCILLPEIMMHVSLVADQFKVPWGVAFNRLYDLGLLVAIKGVLHRSVAHQPREPRP